MTDMPLEYELAEAELDAEIVEADEVASKHKHTYMYDFVSLTGAKRCNRCSAFVSGDEEDIAKHDQMHEQLELLAEALLALNGDVREPGASSKKEKKKGKKRA